MWSLLNSLKLVFYLYVLCFILNVISEIILLFLAIFESIISEFFPLLFLNLCAIIIFPILAEKAYKKEVRVPYPQNQNPYSCQSYTGSFICSSLNFFSFIILFLIIIEFYPNLIILIPLFLFLISGFIAFFCSILMFIYYRREKAIGIILFID